MAEKHTLFLIDVDLRLLHALQGAMDSLLESDRWIMFRTGDAIPDPVLLAMRVLWANGGDPVYLEEDAEECYLGNEAMAEAFAGLLAYIRDVSMTPQTQVFAEAA